MELAFHASMRASEEGTRINEPICGKYSVWRPSGLRKGALASSQLLPLAMREAPRVDAVRPQRAKARTVVSCPPGRCTTRKFLPDSALLPPLPARCRAALGRRPWGSERVAQRRACRRGDPDGTHVPVHRAVPRLDPPPQLVQRRRAGAAKAVQVEPRSKPGGQHRLLRRPPLRCGGPRVGARVLRRNLLCRRARRMQQEGDEEPGAVLAVCAVDEDRRARERLGAHLQRPPHRIAVSRENPLVHVREGELGEQRGDALVVRRARRLASRCVPRHRPPERAGERRRDGRA
mmetsp:Transcript_38719/g.115888  ORF Transcript_38719/g.115888 Transcript_38719/m.115888 type:complete len:290 (-) Transcript_38719:274-1143(-)